MCAALALLTWTALTVIGVAGGRYDLKRFHALRGTALAATSLPRPGAPDFTLWNIARVRAWQATLQTNIAPPIAILRIPKLRLEVAVLPGTGELVLNRAVGHIEDTARPGDAGNAGIAGHRDGFFRGLKDIAIGDAIELETHDGHRSYRVARTSIVPPDDVSVLEPTATHALTLVTCYPFYFIGPAPQRFIVRAVADAR
jgi:sortase A